MRLIDADELISEFACRMDDSVDSIPTKNIIRFIESAPDVDAAPVVRCKECEYWSDYDWRPLEMYPDDANRKYCELINISTHSGFYCSYGEMKDNTDD